MKNGRRIARLSFTDYFISRRELWDINIVVTVAQHDIENCYRNAKYFHAKELWSEIVVRFKFTIQHGYATAYYSDNYNDNLCTCNNYDRVCWYEKYFSWFSIFALRNSLSVEWQMVYVMSRNLLFCITLHLCLKYRIVSSYYTPQLIRAPTAAMVFSFRVAQMQLHVRG